MQMSSSLRIGLAQLNMFVGDVAGNAQRVIDASAEARDRLNAELVLFPELTLCGYPPEDLLFHNGMRKQVAAALERVRTETRGIGVLIGYPEYAGKDIYNSAALIRDGEMLANYRKQELPNYSVFDEKRYFKHGRDSCVVELKGVRIAILICEDVWEPGSGDRRAAGGRSAHRGHQRIAIFARLSGEARKRCARTCARHGASCRLSQSARRPG
jgi:NAD+ synthase (glutamine-hydrolysing)